jgi:hypothetical protein
MRLSVTSFHLTKSTNPKTQDVEAAEFGIKVLPPHWSNPARPSGIAIYATAQGSTDQHRSSGSCSINVTELQKIVNYAVEHGLVTLPGSDELLAAHEALLRCMSQQRVPPGGSGGLMAAQEQVVTVPQVEQT